MGFDTASPSILYEGHVHGCFAVPTHSHTSAIQTTSSWSHKTPLVFSALVYLALFQPLYPVPNLCLLSRVILADSSSWFCKDPKLCDRQCDVSIINVYKSMYNVRIDERNLESSTQLRYEDEEWRQLAMSSWTTSWKKNFVRCGCWPPWSARCWPYRWTDSPHLLAPSGSASLRWRWHWIRARASEP